VYFNLSITLLDQTIEIRIKILFQMMYPVHCQMSISKISKYHTGIAFITVRCVYMRYAQLPVHAKTIYLTSDNGTVSQASTASTGRNESSILFDVCRHE
jgi:hypothetical protein